ncbi:DivIVA domain-containing protein [Arthrobacter sp. Sa2CUA1]|uniref:DivIVA domain-containing protein n=1 Tax=Arthrobacter gallicola TaxID=2762225 RepID=A0ABR8UT73_9MICC|nr:DivIVA domain-containing protein [Arthrobacter gallicola]MBD7995296.1 DivIVA domain-containing protein [Arthrobacter gallicola]
MMILLAFLAIAVVGAVAVFVAGRSGPGGWRRAAAPEAPERHDARRFPATAGLAEPDPRLPPVLLPERPVAADVADLRFSVALRGYRMDEVDEVLERLAAALLERDAALAELRAADRMQVSGEVRPEQPE